MPDKALHRTGARSTCTCTYILILMLKLELLQVLLPRSEAPNADVRAFILPVPAHVGPLRLTLHPPILFPDARPGSVKFELVQALCCLVHL